MRELPIVVGGFFRSGTSLVRRLLDAHSGIHCGPEVKFLKDFNNDFFRDPLSHARFFSTARTYNLSDDELLRLFGEAFIRFHELAARRAGKIRWADKNPENVLFLGDWQTLLPDGFAFIHVVRHPLDALASLNEVGFRLAVPGEFSERARLYSTYRHAGQRYVEANEEASFQLSYEDLTSEPEKTLKRLFEFLGEEFEPEVMKNFSSPERGRGIEDPKITATSSIHRDSVGRWRADLRESEVAAAQDILGSLLGEYGL